ncbi:MAG: HEAT repeat domain-containing protein [Limisphaerales bacterium]
MPVLISDFHHTNDQVRFYAVSAVMHIRGDPAVVVPTLQSALKDGKVETRWNAFVGLSMYGRQAEAAVPDLLECRESAIAIGNHDLKEQVDVALWRIAPEKRAKANGRGAANSDW